MKGWVYVISNRSIEGSIKVGFSTKDPKSRANDLGTGSPTPYVVEYEALVENPKKIEKDAHIILAQYNHGKEWFKCSIDIAISAIRSACKENKILFEVFADEKPNTKENKGSNVSHPTISKNPIADGLAYFYGKRGKERNYLISLKYLFPESLRGNAEAQYFSSIALSLLCDSEYENFKHDFCIKDTKDNLCINLLRMSSDSGFAMAQADLGWHNQYIMKDISSAIELYKLSAANGNPKAMRYLADCYLNGFYYSVNAVKAKELYEASAALKDRTSIKS